MRLLYNTRRGSELSGSRKLKKLTPEKMAVIETLLATPLSLAAIARATGVSRARIWQIANPDYRNKNKKSAI